jgi:pyridoxamine 5'-phosphate oxidase
MNELSQVRKEYKQASLDLKTIKKKPLALLKKWLEESFEAQIAEPNAMILSTTTSDHRVSSRVVLIKNLDFEGITFFTNYNSAKSLAIKANPYVSLLFFWPELERQIRIEGFAKQSSKKESDKYFDTRPLESKIGAWSSPQSEEIPSRDWLEKQVVINKEKFGLNPPRPPFWGGYKIIPEICEFWQGRESRLHDRICFYSNQNKSPNNWTIRRLAP